MTRHIPAADLLRLEQLPPPTHQWVSDLGDWASNRSGRSEVLRFHAHLTGREDGDLINVHLSDPDSGLIWPAAYGTWIHKSELIPLPANDNHPTERLRA
jgi:hypothetical protein